jgi:hypothetical protein
MVMKISQFKVIIFITSQVHKSKSIFTIRNEYISLVVKYYTNLHHYQLFTIITPN